MKQSTRTFIIEHHNDDVRSLALQAQRFPDVEMPVAIEQIAGWQKARTKLPSWAGCDDIIYPGHLALEQCSSEQTARYKALATKRWMQQGRLDNGTFADLTGGMGVDFSFIAPLFSRSIYIERQHDLCKCAQHNFEALHIDGAEVWEGDSIQLLNQLPHLQLLFIDPARRNKDGGRTVAINDCTPNILPLLPLLLDKADTIMVKLSPMLDWHETRRALDASSVNSVREIHIVATANECKELLVVLSAQPSSQPLTICCANDNDTFVTDEATEQSAPPTPLTTTDEARSASWLHEPHAAIMKGGCFATLAQRFHLKALAHNSHLFVADTPAEHFPGRRMHILGTTTMNKRQLRENLGHLTHANITVRNFPMTAAQLRQRLKLADGGNTYLFATTTADNTHLIFICEKI